MYCPFCNADDTKVIDSRLVADGHQVRRRRECLACHERFTTFESAELVMPRIIKRDGSREPFNEDKLRSGLLRSLEKRPVSTEQIEQLINKIKSQLRATGEREVGSQLLGNLIMDELVKVDKVAYVRFASVYRSFKDIREFGEEIARLGGKSLMFSAADTAFMAQAIRLAELGRYTTSPNPNVGAVLVKDGAVIGDGYHKQAGGPHAEVYALREAGAAARGATCYVTLEPCSHYGRTPPCAEALVAARVARVVVAMQDPNPQVAGRGVAMLRAAGIMVEVGLLEAQARAVNPGFLSRMERQRPYVQLKLAASLDGRTALANGDSKWLTGEAARADVQHYRAQSCAVLSTATTVIADNARLNLRAEQLLRPVTTLDNGGLRQPKRVILDRNGVLDSKMAIFDDGGEVLLCVSKLENDRQLPNIARQIHCPLDNNAQFDLPVLLEHLALRENINTLWVEAGATLAGTLMQLKLVDELIVYIAPKLLGNAAQPLAVLPQFNALATVPQLSWTDIRMVGQDLRLTARLT